MIEDGFETKTIVNLKYCLVEQNILDNYNESIRIRDDLLKMVEQFKGQIKALKFTIRSKGADSGTTKAVHTALYTGKLVEASATAHPQPHIEKQYQQDEESK